MKKVLVALLVIALLGTAGAAGWRYAADRGLIPGRPNSPREENFKRALDQYLSRTTESYSRPCVATGYSNRAITGFPDTRFDWTPVGFRAVLDTRTDAQAAVRQRFDILQKQGFLKSTPAADGAVEYAMTWQGFAATNGSGCFYVAGSEREAKIIGFEKKRVENRVDIYEVTAKPMPAKIEPWSQTAEFRDLFSNYSSFKQQLDPNPSTYELARGETGFVVLSERGRQTLRTRATDDAAVTAKLIGTLTADRVKKAVESYMAKAGPSRSQLCLRLPLAPGETDEVQPAYQGRTDPSQKPSFSYTFYNLPGRERYAAEGALRGYELMRRMESLGLAKSELLNIAEFRGMPAAGAVRFEIPEAIATRFTPGFPWCYPVGTLQLEEIVHLTQFSEWNLRPRFVGRMVLKPVDEDAKRIIDKFGHLARVQSAGTLIQGTLRYADGEVQVENAQIHMPGFSPDVSQVSLPVISLLPQSPASSSASSGRAAKPAPPPSGRGFISVPAPAPGPGAMQRPAGSFEVYAIGVYEGTLPPGVNHGYNYHPEGKVNVAVRRVSKPVVVYLQSYEPVNWILSVSPGTKLVRVVLGGYHPQRVTATGISGVEVLRVPYRSISSSSGPADVARVAQAQLGLSPVSAQYNYKGGSFEIGTR